MKLISVVVIIVALSGLSRALKDPICGQKPAQHGYGDSFCATVFPRYSYYQNLKECQKWLFSCGITNENHFKTKEECEAKCKE
ncbi:trypsin inhibitor-like [Drosophila miranda]|uniref:trypsin inhibitor-like n=1 Tax=Drosophila miranda TaxID=7229 RepID=UPI0007E5CCAE|nr:trypsin inhibitor-like [Drosophila miranda]